MIIVDLCSQDTNIMKYVLRANNNFIDQRLYSKGILGYIFSLEGKEKEWSECRKVKRGDSLSLAS